MPCPCPARAPPCPAGDRFRECYYWDSYWSLRGLLACGLLQPAAQLVDNLLHLLAAHGFVPNGARSYYLNRRCACRAGRQRCTRAPHTHTRGQLTSAAPSPRPPPAASRRC
jgi:hypothetical protein